MTELGVRVHVNPDGTRITHPSSWLVDPTATIVHCQWGNFPGQVVVGARCIVGANVFLDSGTHLEDDVIIGEASNLGLNVFIGKETRIGTACMIGGWARILHGCTLGDFVVVGPQCEVRPGVHFPGSWRVPEGSLVNNGVHPVMTPKQW